MEKAGLGTQSILIFAMMRSPVSGQCSFNVAVKRPKTEVAVPFARRPPDGNPFAHVFCVDAPQITFLVFCRIPVLLLVRVFSTTPRCASDAASTWRSLRSVTLCSESNNPKILSKPSCHGCLVVRLVRSRASEEWRQFPRLPCQLMGKSASGRGLASIASGPLINVGNYGPKINLGKPRRVDICRLSIAMDSRAVFSYRRGQNDVSP